MGSVPETSQADVVPDELLELQDVDRASCQAQYTTIHLEASGQGLKQPLDHQTTTITAWRPRHKTYRGRYVPYETQLRPKENKWGSKNDMVSTGNVIVRNQSNTIPTGH